MSFYVGPWSKIKDDLVQGKIDVLPVVGRTAERDKVFDFTFPYFSMKRVVFTHVDNNTIRSFEDLKNTKIAALEGDVSQEYIKAHAITNNVIITKSWSESFQLLSKKSVDAIIIKNLVGLKIINDLGLSNINSLDTELPNAREDYCFAVKEGDKELLALLNEGLSVVIADGTLMTLKKKWMGDWQEKSNKHVIYSLSTILTIVVIYLLYLIRNRWTLAKKNKYAEEKIRIQQEYEKRLQEANEKLKILSVTDHLTQINNRVGIEEIGKSLFNNYQRYKHTFGVIILDIDHFKHINDTFGHHAGDIVLKELVSIVKNSIRRVDQLGRWGGEEFIIFCPETSLEETKVVAENLRVKVEAYNFSVSSDITASFGVTCIDESDTIESVIKRADVNLYKAKQQGRNLVI